MKKRIGLIAIITIIAIVVCLLLWRLWPHTLSSLISLDKDSVTSFWAQATVIHSENEQSYNNTYYSIDIAQQQNSTLREILEILNTSYTCKPMVLLQHHHTRNFTTIQCI